MRRTGLFREAKRPPWLLIWGRYLLLLAFVALRSAVRKAWPALLAFLRLLQAAWSAPLGVLNFLTDLQVQRAVNHANSVGRGTQMAYEQQQAISRLNQMNAMFAHQSQSNEQYLAMLANQQQNVAGLYTQYLAQAQHWQPPPYVTGQLFYPSSPNDQMKAFVQRIYGLGP